MRLFPLVRGASLVGMALGCLAVPLGAAGAQVGETTDIITGVVIDEYGNPLPDVVIEALSVETQIVRSVQTDRLGRFTILFPDGGGQYEMTARRVGLTPVRATLVRYADEDRLVWDVRMTAQPFVLSPIEVEARLTPVVIPDPPTPGSTERSLRPDVVAGLPIDPEDLNVLATLVPGVVGLDATDSSDAAFSVAGLRPDANAITLDGMTFESGNVPQDGLRNTRIVTSTYDVSRGRFSGGLIASTTRGGTNRFQSTLNYALRDDDLAIDPSEESAFTSGFTMHRLSGGVGGPLARNKLFLYGSAQARIRSDPLASLSTATPGDLERLGVAPDSVARLLEIAARNGAMSGRTFGDHRSNDNVSALLRLDYLASSSHTVTLRGDLRTTQQDPTRTPQLGLPDAGGVSDNGGAGIMARVASRFGLHMLNEAQVYVSQSHRDADPYRFATPQGRVQVASELPDGSVGIRTLTLGGSSSLPTLSRSSGVELSNEVSWLPGTAVHRVKLGGLLNVRSVRNDVSRNQSGTYTFTSLDAFETNRAASYRRTLVPGERATHGVEYAVFAGDVWRVSRAFQLTYGVRLEGSAFGDAPEYNPAIDSAFGFRTDDLPRETFLSPRAGFTWTVGGGGGARPSWIIRGGAGAFRSPIPEPLVAAAQVSNGFDTSESEFTCIGPAVPAPDWPGYDGDPGALPAGCALPGGPAGGARAPNASVFADDFGGSKAWRASLGVQRSLSALLRLSLDASYARGASQYGFEDLNLDTGGGFTLAGEADRPVYVDPAQIVPGTGAARLADSRLDPAFGQVYRIGSDLGSETTQLTLGVNGFTRSGIRLALSYTWQHARDQASGSVRLGGAGFGSNPTAGDPNVREWSRSEYERRHGFLTTVSVPIGRTLEITGIGRLTSGVPYTPMVAGDLNGDGARNDRAFVYPAGTVADAGTAGGMARLLAETSAGARSCLLRQAGRIAERNSCLGPWQGSFDLQVNYRPRFLGLNGNLQLSVVTLNLLHGVDELVHGTDGVKGWGVRSRPDEALLYVTGFDAAARAFTYQVNERFGATRRAAATQLAPFQIGFQARLTLGPDRVRDAVDRLRGGGRGAGGGVGRAGRPGWGGGLGRAGSPEEFLDRFRSLFPNPPALILEMRDSLALTEGQIALLASARDTLRARNDSLAAELRREIEEAGTNRPPQELLQLMRPKTQRARANVLDAVRAVREILTAEQWDLLPEAWRTAGRGGPGRRGSGPGG